MTLIEWDNSALALSFTATKDRPVELIDIRPAAAGAPESSAPSAATRRARQPLVEILTPTWGNENWGSCNRHSGTRIGANLRYVSHQVDHDDKINILSITQSDPESGLQVISEFRAHMGIPAVRSTTTVGTLPGAGPVTLWAVTSLATGAVISGEPNNLDVWHAETSWCAENRWQSRPLRSQGMITVDPAARGATTRDSIRVSSIGGWSSGAYLPAGAIQDRDSGRTLAWQIEHNGGWQWEVGERPHTLRPESASAAPVVGSDEAAGPPQTAGRDDGAYVALLGPIDALHQWSYTVDADHEFTTIPVSFSTGPSFADAFGHLAAYRRAVRRPHPQNTDLPVIFNDYMDTLEGDPTEAKLLPLIDAAAEVGCEYFCIDAGWYDDTSGWWASVGDWQPSTVRFPRGLRFVLDHIRSRGMVPGLWMEPEVVGITSQAATSLPDSAFLQRNGIRVRERNRYLLDLRSPAAVAHLDAAVDRLIDELGVGFFKFDYNVTPGAGTDRDAPSVGHGLLEHNRALLAWLDRLLDRHPKLIIENCASGAMRSDFAMLFRLALQSTTDQQDPLLYPAIAAGALVHLLPEQAGNWAYPQATMNDELIIFNMCTGLAGRIYQAGLIDRMSPAQRALVAAGIAVHKGMRADLIRSVPRFPTGMPSWDQPWTTVALDAGEATYLIAWRQRLAPNSVRLELADVADRTIEQIYPPVGAVPDWQVERHLGGLTLTATEEVPAARVYKITD
ncbi:MAG TPA: glycoside hydrolase family 36 protein [Microlunatus sp.]